MKKTLLFLLFLSAFLSLLLIPFNQQVFAAPKKYKIVTNPLTGKEICVEDRNGPYTLPECENELENRQNPGFYTIAKILGVDRCIPDASGIYTYSGCKDELANLQHPGKYKIGKLPKPFQDKDGCIPDATGPYTYSQCQDALTLLNTEDFPGIGVGQNPCQGGICQTAIGPIKTGDIRELANQVLRIATGIAGGLALILMVIGAIRVLASSGDQQKLSGGRDMIVAAVAGLLFLIFSIIILRFIGINILGL